MLSDGTLYAQIAKQIVDILGTYERQSGLPISLMKLRKREYIYMMNKKFQRIVVGVIAIIIAAVMILSLLLPALT